MNLVDCFVYVGICIIQFYYEVDEWVVSCLFEVYLKFGVKLGKWMVDFKGVNLAQLLVVGIFEVYIEVLFFCIWVDNDYYFLYW